jgi:hypothetical protein
VIVGEISLRLPAAIWWLWWRLPQRQVVHLSLKIRDPKARADVEDNFRKTVSQALGGAAVLIGAAAAYLQFTQQQRASHDLLISNQVSKGFEQLAGKETAMRLGGIYALEGVMNTSPDYHQPVLETLCAFVRDGTIGTIVDKDGPATDSQAALTVIRRCIAGPGKIDLSSANISGGGLPGADLRFANLRGADLSGAVLDHANLSGATLNGAKLGGVDLSGADLSGALAQNANLSGAVLEDANLDSAFVADTDLSGARLARTNLSGAVLSFANLSGAYLEGANLSGVFLAGANLSGAILTDAKFDNQEQLDQTCGKHVTLPDGSVRDLKPCYR